MRGAHTEDRWCLDCDRTTLHTVWVRRCSTEGTRCNACNREG